MDNWPRLNLGPSLSRLYVDQNLTLLLDVGSKLSKRPEIAMALPKGTYKGFRKIET